MQLWDKNIRDNLYSSELGKIFLAVSELNFSDKASFLLEIENGLFLT